jgi:CHASE3 domain sensor protein
MDNQEPKDQLTVTTALRENLRMAGNWARIVAIVGWISAVVTVIVKLDKGEFASALLTAGIAFVFNMFLYQFSKRISNALESGDQWQLTEAFSNLKIYYKIIGWILILVLALMVVVFIGSILFFVFIKRPG